MAVDTSADARRHVPYAIALTAFCAGFAYAIAAWITDAPLLILFLNGVMLSGAVGLCLAYCTFGIGALLARWPSQGDWFAMGVLSIGLSLLMDRLISIVARDLQQAWIFNTDIQSGRIAMGGFGILCFLIGPYADASTLPRRWGRPVLWAMIGVLFAFAIFAAHHGREPPLRVSSTREGRFA